MDTVLMKTPTMNVIKRETIYGNRTVIDMPSEVMIIALDDDQNVHFLETYMAPQSGFEPTFAKGAIKPGETIKGAPSEGHAKPHHVQDAYICCDRVPQVERRSQKR